MAKKKMVKKTFELSELLKKAEITQPQFAEKMGTSLYRVLAWIRWGIPKEHIKKAAKLLGVPEGSLKIGEYPNSRPFRPKKSLVIDPVKIVQPEHRPGMTKSQKWVALTLEYYNSHRNLYAALEQLRKSYEKSRRALRVKE